jgi:hypothetical protein
VTSSHYPGGGLIDLSKTKDVQEAGGGKHSGEDTGDQDHEDDEDGGKE